MSSALDELSEPNMELLRRNKFCMGIKRGREHQCGSDADENAINKAVELLAEAVRRILRWRVWDSWWVEEIMDEWLEKRDRLEVQLRGKYSEEVINDLLGLVDKFVSYNERFLNYWREVGSEVRKLIDDLLSGRAEVIIWEGEKGISVHGEHVTLEVNKSTGGITVCLVLSDLGGVTIRIPGVFAMTMSKEEYEKFINGVLRALRGGLEEADGVVFKGKAAMGTTQIWQVIAWALLYPSVHVLIDAINVNESDVSITWYLKTTVEALKGKILKNVGKLSKEEVLAFMFTAVLGDGSAEIIKVIRNGHVYDEAVIKMTMSDERYKVWEPLFERLESMGFRNGKPSLSNSNVVNVRFYGSNAIGLARAMINVLPPVLRDIFDALNFEKWLNLRRIAEMELKFRKGEMQVDVTGYKFTVCARKRTVVLIHQVRD
ncbi:hypothetical protein, partial [Vulcanisaeta sp. JCM 14467]